MSSGLYLDDWFLSSVKDYSTLHMYELQQPTRALTWTSSNGICVGCLLSDERTELLQLKLPGKLLLKGEKQDLCKERDFKVLGGGFHSSHVQQIIGIGNTAQDSVVCCTESGMNCVTMWSLGTEDSDLMVKQCTINNELPQYNCACKLACVGKSSNHVIYGSQVNDICIMDVQKQCNIQHIKGISSKHRLSNIICMDENNFLMGTNNSAKLHVIDLREASRNIVCDTDEKEDSISTMWTFDHASHGTNKGMIMQLSTRGEAIQRDARNMSLPVNSHMITPCDIDNQSRAVIPHSITIRISPTENNTFSVSGLNGPHINIYTNHKADQNSKLTNQNEQKIEPHFQHKGHAAESDVDLSELFVTNHIWHASEEHVVLSSASDGGLHAWKFVDQT